MPLLRTKYPRQNERSAIGSLGHGGGGAGRKPVALAAGSAGEGGRTARDSPATGLWAWLGVESAGKGTQRHGRAAAAGSPARLEE
jgi:hypothetical protein